MKRIDSGLTALRFIDMSAMSQDWKDRIETLLSREALLIEQHDSGEIADAEFKAGIDEIHRHADALLATFTKENSGFGKHTAFPDSE